MLGQRAEPLLAGASYRLGVLALLAAPGNVPRAGDHTMHTGMVDQVDNLRLEPAPRTVCVHDSDRERLDPMRLVEHAVIFSTSMSRSSGWTRFVGMAPVRSSGADPTPWSRSG